MTLTCEDFRAFQQQPPKIERLDVPEMEGECFIRTILATTRDAYNATLDDGENRDLTNLSARLVVLCLCDESGNLLFADANEGARVLGGLPTSITEGIYHACRRLNHIGSDMLKGAVKNSAGTDESDSSSDLPDL